ncbi:oligopeptide/dipeptide ABC transporter ATP-binding protein [Paenibacillus castaneae]|uniref:ABC transporter ATP-binding protein n=1 Tax=Paenibacillus castaneae TaxID=474957 RepID=UPI000C9CFB99|nr:ABC transporter ATP-binding protein [Paenibacillus castaneae]NIK76882.1 oligopeptide/dipeptide ABC transporter ATP-binding protein [Paenibacillus castaneae]
MSTLIKWQSSKITNEDQQPLLEVKGLKTYFHIDGKVSKAVDDVDFTVFKGETLALVGESGSGKSITSLSIMGLIPQPPGKIEAGSILFGGKDLLKLSDKEMMRIRGNDIGMIFQEPMTSLNPVFTIGYQVAESLMRHKKMKKKDAYRKTVDLLKLVGFARADDIIHDYPHQLSGGMRQRVMIAIAVACNPDLLIADEPTTALDVTIQAQILDLLLELKKEFNSSILLITHDLGVVAETADRVMVMYGGQIVEEASVHDLFTQPKHPYAIGLLESIPNMDRTVERLHSIPGTVPPSDRFPEGCRFEPRCPMAMEKCRLINPELIEIEPNRKVRCHLFGK